MRDVSGPRVISARGQRALDISLNSLTFKKKVPAIDGSSDLKGYFTDQHHVAWHILTDTSDRF